jgi:hypothetical protein
LVEVAQRSKQFVPLVHERGRVEVWSKFALMLLQGLIIKDGLADGDAFKMVEKIVGTADKW